MKRILNISLAVIVTSIMTINLVGCNIGENSDDTSESDFTNISSSQQSDALSSFSDSNDISVGGDVAYKPSELTPTEVLYTYLEVQKNFISYKSVTTGTTKAKVLFTNYVQNANNTTFKSGNEYFQECVSKSTFVDMTHQVFVKENKVVYRNASEGELTTVDKAKYKEVYGVSPDDDGLGGYIINSKTLKSVEKTQEKDGLYTYKLVLDGQAASVNMVKQMKEFGGLKDYPTIHTLTLYLTIKCDWTPVKLVVDSTYDISIAVLGNLSCTHDFTTEYSLVNATVNIPNIEEFRAKLN